MKTFTIIIWQWQKVLHQKEVRYKTYEEADCYAHGVFDTYHLLGKKPTGLNVK